MSEKSVDREQIDRSTAIALLGQWAIAAFTYYRGSLGMQPQQMYADSSLFLEYCRVHYGRVQLDRVLTALGDLRSPATMHALATALARAAREGR